MQSVAEFIHSARLAGHDAFGVALDFERCAQISAANAAAWWAGRLRDAVGVGDNGDHEWQSAAACYFTRLIRDRNPPTEDNCKRFEDELRNALTVILTTQTGNHYRDAAGFCDGGVDVCMRVDYHPDRLLMECLLAAGIERGICEIAALPLKTTVRASARRVTVAHGYGAPWVEIHGPAWGCSREQQGRADEQRGKEADRVWDEWEAAGSHQPRAYGSDWQGPVRP